MLIFFLSVFSPWPSFSWIVINFFVCSSLYHFTFLDVAFLWDSIKTVQSKYSTWDCCELTFFKVECFVVLKYFLFPHFQVWEFKVIMSLTKISRRKDVFGKVFVISKNQLPRCNSSRIGKVSHAQQHLIFEATLPHTVYKCISCMSEVITLAAEPWIQPMWALQKQNAVQKMHD